MANISRTACADLPGTTRPHAAYGGFCFLNNAAIAAQYLIDNGVSRVSIIDVDAHHGNGTQQIFWTRGDVHYLSLHMDPDSAPGYPWFVGHADEIGQERGLGTNLNVPLAPGTDGAAYRPLFERALDAVTTFNPECIVLSLGVDAAAGDPVAALDLTTGDFGAIGAMVAGLGRPVVVVQEGGYGLDRVGPDVRATLQGLMALRR